MHIEDPEGIGLEQDIGIHGRIEGGIKGYAAFLDNGIFAEGCNPKSLLVGRVVGKIDRITGKGMELLLETSAWVSPRFEEV